VEPLPRLALHASAPAASDPNRLASLIWPLRVVPYREIDSLLSRCF